LISSALLPSCRKSSTEPQQQTDARRMDAFLKSNAPQFETFTINAATGGTVTNSKGSKFIIKPNSFTDLNGNAVTGNVTVSVKEIGKASEMIFGDRPAMGKGGNPLISFGEFQINAQAGGNQLRLRQDSAVRGVIRPQQPAGGQLIDVPVWDGDTIVTATANGHNHLNQPVTISSSYPARKGIEWNQAPGQFMTPQGGGEYGFNIRDLLNWTNCDALYSQPGTKRTVLCYFASNFNNNSGNNFSGSDPSVVFFKVKNQNVTVKLYNKILNAPAGFEGFLSYQNSIPEGTQGTFLAFSVINGQFFAEMKDVTIPVPTPGNDYVSFSFNPQPVSEAGLKALIQQMDNK
jgi:hypothetical protein